MNTRFFVAAYFNGTGETGTKAGSSVGYQTARQAIAVAENLAKQSGATHSVDEYYVEGEERDYKETVCYCHPEGE